MLSDTLKMIRCWSSKQMNRGINWKSASISSTNPSGLVQKLERPREKDTFCRSLLWRDCWNYNFTLFVSNPGTVNLLFQTKEAWLQKNFARSLRCVLKFVGYGSMARKCQRQQIMAFQHLRMTGYIHNFSYFYFESMIWTSYWLYFLTLQMIPKSNQKKKDLLRRLVVSTP